MPPATLTEIERAVRAGWSAETCDPVDLPWNESAPARGQCGVTALVLHDLLGGELLCAEVRNPDGSAQGVHYWNRLAGGHELDLTREQFTAGHAISEPHVVPVPANRSTARLAGQYQRLREAVERALGRAET